MTAARRWPEYAIEGWALGTFMVSACLFTALFEHPASRLHTAIPDPVVRRGLIGLAMGMTAIALIYSAWGQRSGAHMNPAVTLTFWRLGKVSHQDAAFYVIAQVVGGTLGVVLSDLVVRGALAHPAVGYIVTIPGPQGVGVAFAAEFVISFLLMLVVLFASSRPALSRYTGLMAGTLVALYILVEAPLSGMSMNPARTIASAVVARRWDAAWIYFVAPPLAMLLAAEVYTVLAHGACETHGLACAHPHPHPH